jgi:beta-lactamase class A
MRDTRTGLHRLRAGLPADWDAGDKTGSARHESMRNKHNDVAFLRPRGRAPNAGLVVVASYHESPQYFETPRAVDDAVHADVGRLVADWIVNG